jgi:hypothetical protein
MIHAFVRDGENVLEMKQEKKLGALVGRHVCLEFKGRPTFCYDLS